MFFMLPASVERGVDVGALVARCLVELELTHKDCWITCGYGDGAQWHRALKGQAPLDLWKLRHLPIKWWQLFLPKLASALIVSYFEELQVPYRMARAAIEKQDERKSA